MADRKVVLNSMDEDIDIDDGVLIKRGRGFQENERDLDKYDNMLEDKGGNIPQKSIEGWIIFVRNVHEEALESDLHDKFSEFGEILNLHLNFDRRTAMAKGYCLIEYTNHAEARLAIESMNGEELYEKPLEVSWGFIKGPETKRSTQLRTEGTRTAGRLGQRRRSPSPTGRRRL